MKHNIVTATTNPCIFNILAQAGERVENALRLRETWKSFIPSLIAVVVTSAPSIITFGERNRLKGYGKRGYKLFTLWHLGGVPWKECRADNRTETSPLSVENLAVFRMLRRLKSFAK